MADPDEMFENIAKKLLPFWGPFYAMYYIIRYLFHELAKKRSKRS